MTNAKRNTTFTLVTIALFTALIAVGAFIKIPIPLIPFTLQTFFVTLAGMMLGKKGGAVSAFLYMALGLIGLPIFTQGGGFSYVFKPTFGYIIGFIFGAFVTGLIVEKSKSRSYKVFLGAAFAGLFVLYIFGVTYFYIIMNLYLKTPTSVGYVLLYGFLVTIPGDTVMTFLGALIAKRLMPVVEKYRF